MIIIAHRGSRDRFPENTIEAFKAAVDDAADMIELDVAFTKDRRLVVIHDDSLDRTTNGRGPVDQYTLAELKRLDAGSWFSPTFSGCRLPELEEVFDTIGNSLPINVEIKSGFYEENPKDDPIETIVLNLLNKFDLVQSAIISSFEPAYLYRLSRMDSPPRLALITELPLDSSGLETLKKINAVSWHPWHGSLTLDQVNSARELGCLVYSYTVNSKDDFIKVRDMGVDGVFTDHVKELQSYVAA